MNVNLLPTSGLMQVSSRLTEVFEDYHRNPISDRTEKCQNFEDERESWLLYLLKRMSEWLWKTEHSMETTIEASNEQDEEAIWRDWEWILDRTEEFSLISSQSHAKEIGEELEQLRKKGSNLRYKRFFQKVAKLTFSNMTCKEKQMAETPLDVSKTSKIISDLISKMEDHILSTIQCTFYLENPKGWNQFRASYHEKPYERNIEGSLKELAFASSHGQKGIGLSSRSLADILWSLWKTLQEGIKKELGRNLEEDELRLLANTIALSKDLLMTLYIQTVSHSKVGRKQEGKVIQKWKKLQKVEEERIRKMKENERKEGIDARYEYKPVEIAPHERSHDLQLLRSQLASRLTFSVV